MEGKRKEITALIATFDDTPVCIFNPLSTNTADTRAQPAEQAPVNQDLRFPAAVPREEIERED